MFAFIGQWLLFVVLNLLAGINAFLLGLHYTRSRDDLIEFIATWITIFLGQVVLVQTLLGALGWLNSWNILVVLSAVLIVSLVRFKIFNKTLQLPLHWGQELRSVVLFLQRDRNAQIVFLLVVWILSGFSISALAKPSTLWDALAYHLPMAVDWMQSQYLRPSYIPGADVANSYFPGNGELLYLWALAPFHNDLLVRLVSVCMWFVLAVALFRVCRKMGASDQASAATTILFLFTPLVLSQATQLTLDMTGAAIFLLAFGYLFEFERPRHVESMVLFSIAGGLFLGVKYSGPAYLLLLCGGASVILLRRNFSGQVITYFYMIFVSFTVLFGGYWFIRNLMLTGSPVYPLQISLLGRTVFPGAISSAHYDFRRLWDHLGDIQLSDLLRAASRSLGIPYLLLLAISGFLSLERLYHHKAKDSRSSRPATLILLLGLIPGSLLLYLNTPYSIMRFGDDPITINSLAEGMRFAMVAFALCCPLIALGFSHRPKLLVVLWLILPILLAQSLLFGYDLTFHSFFSEELVPIRHSFLAGAIITLGAFACYAWTAYKPCSNLLRCMAPYHILVFLVLVTFGVGAGMYEAREYRERFRYDIYRKYGDIAVGWKWVSQNVHNARVALAGSLLSHPLYGHDLSNEVRYVNIVGDLDDRYHDYEPFSYRKGGSYGIWLRNLGEWGAQYLVVTGPAAEEKKWAAEHPEVFGLVFSNSQIRIYRIDKTRVSIRLPW